MDFLNDYARSPQIDPQEMNGPGDPEFATPDAMTSAGLGGGVKLAQEYSKGLPVPAGQVVGPAMPGEDEPISSGVGGYYDGGSPADPGPGMGGMMMESPGGDPTMTEGPAMAGAEMQTLHQLDIDELVGQINNLHRADYDRLMQEIQGIQR